MLYICEVLWQLEGVPYEEEKEMIEIQYAKTSSIKVELMRVYTRGKSKYALIKCSLLINKIPIAETTRTLEAGDTLEFSNHQAVMNQISYDGFDPLFENIERVKIQLLPSGKESKRDD